MMHWARGRFVSLRWKLVLATITLLLLISLVIGLLGLRRFDEQVGNVLVSQHHALWRDYSIRLKATEQRLVSLSHEFHLMLGEDGRLTLAGMSDKVAHHWQDFELFWRLEGLGLFTTDLTPVLRQGAVATDVTEVTLWMRETLSLGEPSLRLRCQLECLVDVAIPVLVDDQIHLMVMVSDLSEVLAPMAEHHQIEVALLSAEAGAGPWSRRVLSITDRAHTQPLLRRFAEQTELTGLQRGPTQLEWDGRHWALFAWPLGPGGEQLMLLRDVSDLTLGERAFVGDLVGILLMAVLLAGGLGTLALWRPLARLHRLGRALPLLAQSRYDDLRDRLDHRPGWTKDELDQLERTTLEVAGQLERLEGDVDRYTNELQRMAMMDALTGLPNRAMFHHELAKALGSIGRTDDQIALLFLDLDEFKRVNDTLGHDIGDELLKTVANRLQKSIRSMDTVCRLGGDEFTIIVRGLESEGDIHRIIHQIFTSLQQPLQLGRHTLIITTSIGVVFCDNPMMRPEELLKRADLAMYQAKQAGRSNYRVFNEQMLESASRRLMLEQDIRIALKERQLALAMQPILTMDDNRLVGFEALVRWYHPNRGLVMPSEFIQEVDESKEGVELGNYVLEYAIDLLARYTRQLGNDQFYVAVNLSPNQYMSADLVKYLQGLLERYRIHPSRLVLELTEESLIKNLDRAMAIMQQLKSMGVRIAIDDFGTGYSSLSYLKQLPFDLLKVDRGFVADLDNSDVDRNIVTSVIDLAHNLKRQVVAEGVESHDQRQFLRQIGCDYAQGYLFSAPLDEHQTQVLLSQLDEQLRWPDDERGVQLLGRQNR
ncbi:putative bifunctional diguanylate cyclase/phosphodiesterase [Ferrimonas balearica]|uniref:putative bifunctional diguanylate cyclase/phosphodiesterase n=1 Tax=Ferrimonas balearica TaxID=44012 RepID=UPI001F1AC938|nr:EAL domain-containing protein [Ferrimonas balearica]MBY6095960.1 EAL domain-containing protein [Ferrimonas balearica]